jgi:hypothetical protein
MKYIDLKDIIGSAAARQYAELLGVSMERLSGINRGSYWVRMSSVPRFARYADFLESFSDPWEG